MCIFQNCYGQFLGSPFNNGMFGNGLTAGHPLGPGNPLAANNIAAANIAANNIAATNNIAANNIAATNNIAAANNIATANIAAANNLAVANNLATEAILPIAAHPLGYEPKLAGLQIGDIAASNSRGFQVTSSSPGAPHGLSVLSENLLVEGPLAVTGQLPFLGSVSLEGPLAAAGQGAVSYGCGNGNIGMVNENTAPVGPLPGMPYGGVPMGPGFAGNGFGFNNFAAGIPNELGTGSHIVA